MTTPSRLSSAAIAVGNGINHYYYFAICSSCLLFVIVFNGCYIEYCVGRFNYLLFLYYHC